MPDAAEPAPAERGSWRARLPDTATIFVLALAVRLSLILFSPGGLGGDFGYDPSVYYTAADAFVHGRMPYADFFLLHPPGVMLAVAPFAALGSLIGDHSAFMITDVAFCALGAVNAVLVLLVSRRLGLSRIAALVGAGFYALWFGSAATEISPRLEPLGSFASLCAFLVLANHRQLRRRDAIWVGVALGAASCVKITWFAVLVAVAAWHLRNRRERRNAGWMLLGALGAGLALCGPFLVNSPSAMWRMVVRDQLGRVEATSFLRRVGEFTGAQQAYPQLSRPGLAITALIFGFLVLVIGLAAWQVVRARPFVVVGAVQLAALAASPSYFSYYSGYIGAAFALCLAAAVGSRAVGRTDRGPAAGRAAAFVALASAAIVTITATFIRTPKLIAAFPAAKLVRAVSTVRCLTSDSPMALIALDALSRGLDDGCPNWVDVSGRTYDIDAPRAGKPVARTKNPLWQRDIKAYLLSGDAFIVIRTNSVLSHTTMRELMAQPVLAHSHKFVVYLTKGPAGS